MRLHNNNEEYPIIFDTDIVMTDENNSSDVGTSLHDVINEHDTKIERLESNVKWMYRYGAIGSGGGYNPNTPTSKMTVFIYKDGVQPVSPGTRLMYPGEGTYKFKVEIHGGGSDTFLVKYYYNNGKTLSRILSKDNEFSTEDNLRLEGNNELTITVKNQSTGEFYMVNNSANLTFPYVTSAYNLTANYVLGNDVNGRNYQKYYPNDHIIFMSDVMNDGLMIAINYNIAINIQESSTSIEYTDWDNRNILINTDGTNSTMHISWYDEYHNLHEESKSFDIKLKSNTSGVLYLPLCDDIVSFLSNNDNAAFKQVTVIIKSQMTDETEVSEFGRFNFFDNLIPNGLFLNVRTTAGKLYTNSVSASTALEANQIMSGDILFNVTPYNGSLDATRLYELRTTIYDIVDNEEILNSTFGPTSLIDQKETDLIIPISEVGVKKIVFELTLNGVTASFVYYVKIRTFASSFNWYPNVVISEDGQDVSKELTPYYSATYRRNESVKNMSSSNIFLSGNNNIQMTSNDPMRTIQLYYDPNKYGNIQIKIYDILMAIGIQYSSINNSNVPILSFNTRNSSENRKEVHTIFIYQNKVAISTSVTNISSPTSISLSSQNVDIFIPIEDDYKPSDSTKYHLFNLNTRLENNVGNNYYRSLSTYIDEDLEGLLNSFLTAEVIYDSITLYPGNYSINLLELSLLLHPTEPTQQTWLEDIDINRYFKSYTEKITYRENIYSNNERNLFEIFSGFRFDDKNRIIVDENDIINIAKTTECPVMMLYFDDTGQIEGFNVHNKDNFIDWFERSYEENEDAATGIPVTLQYSNGDGTGLHLITLPDTNGTVAEFSVDIQGSSTKTYRCKNLELYAPVAGGDDEYIYTPNINRNIDDPEYTSSFLPEGSFTLKADVVDSSHTNNNAIGKFVNDNTTQFSLSVRNENQHGIKYTKNIKNTLIGFPILLFLHTRYKNYNENDDLGTYTNNYYFLGIYNFNLGRKSYYNLGYKDIRNIESIIDADGAPESGFAIYKIGKTSNVQMENIVGAEIQGNNAHFDFSQYKDETLLFNETSGMWGDYIGSKEINEIQTDLRNLCKDIAFAGGYTFTQVGKKMSESADDKYGYAKLYSYKTIDPETGKTIEWVPNYHYQASFKQQTGTIVEYEYFPETDNNGVLLNGTLESLKRLIIEYELENGETNIPRVDFTSVAEYYTVMMAMGLVDSPMKNLNVKSWNNGKTFYTAFYDMDTGLGKNNAGTYINYFAFSDFWESQWNSVPRTDYGILNQVNIIRDYSPESFVDDESGSSFFDVPSSYLFNIAKYAKSIFKALDASNADSYTKINDNDPSNIWGRWRNQDTGCLKNAKYFMQKYFNHHLAQVPAEAFNFNYRYKYLVKNKDNTGFDSLNFIKFHGRGLAYSEYWLDGRLHILDAYFNVNGVDDTINIINNTINIKASKTDDMWKPSRNEDVYVLQDAFSGENAQHQYSTQSSGNIIIEARPYSPLIVQYPLTKERYLFPNNGEKSQISVNFTGTVTCLFGGSKLWTSVSSITPFITLDNKFSIYSKYISTIIGETRTCTAWTFDTPSLRTLRLTSPNYSGKIDFISTETTPKFQNLDEINISGTAINLTAQNVPLRSLYAVNMQDGADIQIVGCNKLENVEISGKFNNLQISSWNSEVSLPTSGGNLSCRTITITNNTERFPDASLRITNNAELTTINVSGFSHIYVSNCPKLERINFNDNTSTIIPSLKTLDIQMPSFNGERPFTISSNENDINVVDLSNFDNLSTLRLSNSSITEVRLPERWVDENDDTARRSINLLPNAFANCKFFKGFYNEGPNDLYITGERTFYNCGVAAGENAYKLLKECGSSTQMSNIYISPSCTTLKETFCCLDAIGRLGINIVSEFLKERCTGDDVLNVISIDGMFKKNYITYTFDKVPEYLNETEKCSLPLWGFVNCSSATDVFSDCNVSFCNRYMFEDVVSGKKLFGNCETINLTTMSNSFTYGTYDMLYPFINKTTTIDFKQQPNIIICKPQIGVAQNIPEELNINDLFYNAELGIRPEKLLSIKNFTISPTYTKQGGSIKNVKISLKGLFDNDKQNESEYVWIAAHENDLSLQNFMNATYFVNGTFDETYVNKLFSKIVPTYIINSFAGFTKSDNTQEDINIYTVFDWTKVKDTTYNLFAEEPNSNLSVSFGGFGGTKKCTYTEFKTIWNNLLSSQKLKAISSIFTNCTITNNTWENVEFNLNDNNVINESITTTPSLFKNIKLMNSSNEYCPIDIRSKFFKHIKNIKYVSSIFEYTYMKHAIPFDVFAKRKKSSNYIQCIVKKNNEYVNGQIITFDYNNEIINMNSAFHNVTFSNKNLATFRNNNEDHNYNDFELNYACADENDRFDVYYTYENGDYEEHNVEQPTEIQDINKIWADHQDVELNKTMDIDDMLSGNVELNIYKSTYTLEVPDYADFRKLPYRNLTNFCDTEHAGFVVSPDIFRSCTKTCDISYSIRFDRSEDLDPIVMTGMMPPSIFKVDYLRTMKFEGVFTGLNVSPIEIPYEDEDEITTIESKKIDGVNYKHEHIPRHNIYYQYILDEFTDRDVLSECFNFSLLLPASSSERARRNPDNLETEYESRRTSQHFFMFGPNSLSKNLLRMSDSLPKDYSRLILQDNDEDHMHEFYHTDNGIYFNIMRSFVEVIIDNEHSEKLFRTGIDSNVFRYFAFDSLISSDISKIYEGYVLSENNSWSVTRTSEGATMFFQVGGSNTGFIGLSANAKLQAEQANSRMFPTNGGGYNICKASLKTDFTSVQGLSEYWNNYNWNELKLIVT